MSRSASIFGNFPPQAQSWMRKLIAALAMPSMLAASPPQGKLPAPATALICVEKDAAVERELLDRAELSAGRMFLSIRLKIEWRNKGRSCLQELNPIILSVTTDTPKGYFPRAYGVAFPYEGIHIRVFYDRVQRVRPDLVIPVLAHVLAHEIIHILAGTDFHSATGLMKLRWSQADLEQMAVRSLPFANVDTVLLNLGLRSRDARLAAIRHEHTLPTIGIPSE